MTGGSRDGNFFEGTVLTDVTPENDAYGEEFFGPVAMVFRVSSEDEAIRLGNDTDFGLGSYVFTDDADQAMRVADGLDTGMVYVNGVGADAPSFRSAASSAPASVANSVATASRSSSTRS